MFETENVWKDSSKEEQLSIQLFGNNINKQQNKKKKKVVTKNSKKHSNLSLASENDLKLNVDKEKCNIVSSDIKMKSVSKKRKHEIAESISSKNIKSKAPKLEKKEVVASDLHQKLFNKLQSSRFRFINEKMYTNDSKETVEMFKNDPQSFDVYHKGFKSQLSKWPMNPLDHVISWIKTKPAGLVIADMGCGEAELAQNVKNEVYSFDLYAVNEYVTVADISEVPLDDKSVDIVVFCLSLMGTNLKEFIFEANRILRKKGFLKIVEVASRFQKVSQFVHALKDFGFVSIKVNTENSHFYIFDFQKENDLKENVLDKAHKKLALKPCYYKKR